MAGTQVEQLLISAAQRVRMLVGDYEVLRDYRTYSHRTQVWQLESRAGIFVLKLHHNKLRWRSEVFAYQKWRQAYTPYVPDLVGVLENDAVQGILITALPGIPLREANLRQDSLVEAYKQAGKLCRRLHSFETGIQFGILGEHGTRVAMSGEPLTGALLTDPVSFVKHRLMGLFATAQGLHALRPSEIEIIRIALGEVDSFAGETPVPVNSDYTPGNWLVDQDGRLTGVIDLESMGWGVRMDSIGRLLVRYFPDHAEAERAFHQGNGSNLPLENPLQARIIAVGFALSYLSFGVLADSQVTIERGRNVFRRLYDGAYF